MSGTPRVHKKRPTTPSTQRAQTVTQRRVIHGAGSKSKIPIEEEVDLRGEKVSLKSGMKRCILEEEVRRARGREFQIVGAAKRKDRRAWEDLKKATVSRCWSEVLSLVLSFSLSTLLLLAISLKTLILLFTYMPMILNFTSPFQALILLQLLHLYHMPLILSIPGSL